MKNSKIYKNVIYIFILRRWRVWSRIIVRESSHMSFFCGKDQLCVLERRPENTHDVFAWVTSGSLPSLECPADLFFFLEWPADLFLLLEWLANHFFLLEWAADFSPSLERQADLTPSLERLADISPSFERPLDHYPSLERPTDLSSSLERPAGLSPSLEQPADLSPFLERPLDLCLQSKITDLILSFQNPTRSMNILFASRIFLFIAGYRNLYTSIFVFR